MNNEEQENLSEQDLSEGKLVDREPLEAVEDPPSRLAGYNQVPDFGYDTKGTLQESENKPPIIKPPFTMETALLKVKAAEEAWNTRDPEKVSQAYSVDSEWRNRTEFIKGREEIIQFLKRKWANESDYKLVKELWGFRDNRMAVRFEYEWRDLGGNWFRSYGNELWEFDEEGLMKRRFASINDLPIKESERRLLTKDAKIA